MASAVAWADFRLRLTAAGFASGGVPVPICFPNTTFKAPPGNLPWLRVDMGGGSGQPIELGAGAWQDSGQAYVDIFVPVGSGLAATVALVDAVKSMFRGPPWGDIAYVRISADPGGSGDDDGLYFITNMRAEWQATTIIGPRS